MSGPIPTEPQSFLSIVGHCDNFRVPQALPPQQSGFRTEEVVTWRLDSKPSSPAIGLLRAPIRQQLLEENQSAPPHEAAFAFTDNDGRPEVCFADWVDTPAKRTRVMQDLCTKWRDAGLFEGVIGPKKWRNEMYPVYRSPFGRHDAPSAEGLASAAAAGADTDGGTDGSNFAFMMERAACALFGVVTYGVHLTVYVEDAAGCKIWVPTRARTKPTWPGYLDNSVAGGIAAGAGVLETLVKECMEEASIEEDFVQKHAKSVGSTTYFFRCVSRMRTLRGILNGCTCSTDAGWLQPETE